MDEEIKELHAKIDKLQATLDWMIENMVPRYIPMAEVFPEEVEVGALISKRPFVGGGEDNMLSFPS